VNAVEVTATGVITDEPRSGRSSSGTDWVRLTVGVPVPNSQRYEYVTVIAYALLAIRTAESVRKGDVVTVRADSLRAEAWVARDDKDKAYGRITLRATDIALSMGRDTARSGRTLRDTVTEAPSSAEADAEIPAEQRADLEVLAGVTV
jgi:hypothetical protein